MSRERTKQLCQCGCGVSEWPHKLVQVSIEQAVDISLRQTTTSRRFWVRKQCETAWTEELGMMVLLEQLIRAYPPPARSRWWLIYFWLNPFYPWPRVLRSWWCRVGAARKVLRLTHAIYERTKGFDYARDRAMRSAVLFGCPRFLQGFLAKRFLIRAKRRKAKEDGASPNTAAEEAA